MSEMDLRAATLLRVLSLTLGLLAVAGWGAFTYAIQSSAETEQQLTEQGAELRKGQEQLLAEVAELRTSRDQLVAERVEAHAQLVLAQEEVARLQKQVEQLQAKASVTGSVRASPLPGNPARPSARPQRTRR